MFRASLRPSSGGQTALSLHMVNCPVVTVVMLESRLASWQSLIVASSWSHIYLLTLYMFRARHAHHQERQILSIQPLVTFYVGGRNVCTNLGHQHKMTVTRGCIDTICLS